MVPSADQPEFRPEDMKTKKFYESFKNAGLKLLEEYNCGTTQGNKQDFIRNVVGEQVAVKTYLLEK